MTTYVAQFDKQHLSSISVGQEVDLTMNGTAICKMTVSKIEGNNVFFDLPTGDNVPNWNKVFNSPSTLINCGCDDSNL